MLGMFSFSRAEDFKPIPIQATTEEADEMDEMDEIDEESINSLQPEETLLEFVVYYTSQGTQALC